MTDAPHDIFELPWVMTPASEGQVEHTRERFEQRLASLQAQMLLPTLGEILTLDPAIGAVVISLENDGSGSEFFMNVELDNEGEMNRVSSWEVGDYLDADKGSTIDELLQDLNNVLSGSPSDALSDLLRQELAGKRLTVDGLDNLHRQLAGAAQYDAWKAHGQQQQLSDELPDASTAGPTRPRF